MYWKALEYSGLMVRAWILMDDWRIVCLMFHILPHCCFTPLCGYLVLLIIVVLRIFAYSLLTDCLLSMTHSVLLYTYRSPYKP